MSSTIRLSRAIAAGLHRGRVRRGYGPGPFVAIRFGIAGTAPRSSITASALFQVVGDQQGDLIVTGPNGTLTITDIRLIVDRFELEPVQVASCDTTPKPPSCQDSRTGPL